MRLYTRDIVRESALKADSGMKNPLPHRGIKPASAQCQSDAVPTDLNPRPTEAVRPAAPPPPPPTHTLPSIHTMDIPNLKKAVLFEQPSLLGLETVCRSKPPENIAIRNSSGSLPHQSLHNSTPPSTSLKKKKIPRKLCHFDSSRPPSISRLPGSSPPPP